MVIRKIVILDSDPDCAELTWLILRRCCGKTEQVGEEVEVDWMKHPNGDTVKSCTEGVSVLVIRSSESRSEEIVRRALGNGIPTLVMSDYRDQHQWAKDLGAEFIFTPYTVEGLVQETESLLRKSKPVAV